MTNNALPRPASRCFYIAETRISDNDRRTAMLKPRADIERVFDSLGIARCPFPAAHDGRVTHTAWAKVQEHRNSYVLWKQALAPFGAGDQVYIQYPPLNPCVMLHRVLEACAARGVRIVLVLHDLVYLRSMLGGQAPSWQKGVYQREESRALGAAWRVSAHTPAMRNAAVSLLGVDPDKMVVLGLFDYLIPASDLPPRCDSGDAPLIVAGNLKPEKVGYLYDMPAGVPLRLFGIEFDQSRKTADMDYRGSFPAEELPQHLEGGFGLVWDGDSARTCTGDFGEYLRYNSPHKLSLYLACGMPVVIWDQAAQAPFVKRHNLGLAVSDLNDLPGMLETLSDEDYRAMRDAAALMGKRLRDGFFTSRFVNATLR